MDRAEQAPTPGATSPGAEPIRSCPRRVNRSCLRRHLRRGRSLRRTVRTSTYRRRL